MKLYLVSILFLCGAILVAGAIGFQPTRSHWGADGVRGMVAIGLICLGAAVVGAAPIGIVAPRWPSYIGQAALAGTTIRLMLTAGAGYAYQQLASPHLGSYLLWAGVFYLLLLAVETCFSVMAVRWFYPVPGKAAGGGGLT